MDMSSPQEPKLPRQSSGAGETGRPLKLRSSCDSCSNSKVKCDRQRPACQRCLNAGVRCHYSISRRMGKPAGSGRRDSKTETKTQNSRPSMTTSSVPVTPDPGTLTTALNDTAIFPDLPGQFIADVDSSGLGFGDPTSMPWMDFNLMSDGCGYPSGHSSDGLLSTPALLSFNDSMNLFDNWAPPDQSSYSNRIGSWGSSNPLSASEIDVPPPYNIHDGQTYPRYSSTHIVPFMTQTSSEKRRTHTCNGTIGCHDLASTILQSLYIPSNLCTTSNTKATDPAALSTVDQALTNSRRAISTFSTLLQCPCSGNSSFTLTLALILLKILSCYNAAARCASPSRTRSSSSIASSLPSASSSSTHWDKDSGMAQETVLGSPMMMGAYHMDAENEHHLKLQLFLSELRKVSGLVDAFAGRYCRGLAERGMGNANADYGLYSALETLLRKEWRSAVKEVVAVLRRCDDGVVASVE